MSSIQSTIITPEDDLQAAIDNLSSSGGGAIQLTGGIYNLSSDLNIYSNISLNGIGSGGTVFDFGGGAFQIVAEGTNEYSDGTIITASGVNIEGDSTLWLTNASAGQGLFLGTRWYTIATVIDDTNLVLSEPYDNSVGSFPAPYLIATVISNIEITGVTVTNSTVTGISITDGRKVNLEEVQVLFCDKGIGLYNCSEVSANLLECVANTGNGLEASGLGLCNWTSINNSGNGGAGLSLVNVGKFLMTPGDFEGNAGNGVSLTGVANADLLIAANGNGDNGLEFITGCYNVNVYNISAVGNNNDGVTLTASVINSKIINSNIQSNGGYGINIVDSSSVANILATNILASNSSGQVNNIGTSTLIRSNIGVSDN